MISLQQETRPGRDSVLGFALSAVITPIGYFLYLLAVRRFQGHQLYVEPSPGALSAFLLILALTGVIAVLGWYWGLRITPLLTGAMLLVWPWFYVSIPIGDASYAAIPFAGLLIGTGVEGAFQFSDEVDRLTTTSTGRNALVAGLIHFVLGFGLQVYVRRFFWLDYTGTGVLLMGLVYLVSGVALVATGAFSLFMWQRRRLVTPGLLTAGWFVWGVYGIWRMRATLPWGSFNGINWLSSRPYPDYMLQWTALLIALLLLAGSEYLIQTIGRQLLSGTMRSRS